MLPGLHCHPKARETKKLLRNIRRFAKGADMTMSHHRQWQLLAVVRHYITSQQCNALIAQGEAPGPGSPLHLGT